jgi:hypothetical protein
MLRTRKVESASAGAAIIGGGTRLSTAEELALNLLLKRAGGEENGAQLYKLGWAMEDNQTTFDREIGRYKFDPKKIPICIEANQASYHLLSWAPPTQTDMELEHEFHGEDFSKGTYACIMHFLNPDGSPINPTASMIERIIPVLTDFSEIAAATRKGFTSDVKRLRAQKIMANKQKEAEAAKRYEHEAEALLESDVPAFEGNPTSFPGSKKQSTSDIISPEEYRARLAGKHGVSTRKSSEGSAVSLSNVGFSFSARTPKPKPKE